MRIYLSAFWETSKNAMSKEGTSKMSAFIGMKAVCLPWLHILCLSAKIDVGQGITVRSKVDPIIKKKKGNT